jgi:dihydroflavonol-4-reductase
MKIGITGANGFIGNHLSKYLSRHGHEVIAYIQPGTSPSTMDGAAAAVFYGDITDPASFDPFLDRCEVVFHLVAINQYWAKDPAIFHRVNYLGTRALVEACIRHRIKKFIHVSSCITLGASDTPVARSETSAFNLITVPLAYAHTKKLAEDWIKEQVRDRGFPAVIIHPGSAIGEFDHGTPIGRSIIDISRGRWPVYVAGGACFVDVRDLVHGLWLALEKGRVGEQYLLSGENITNREFMTRVSECAGRSRPCFRIPDFLLSLGAHVGEWLADHVFKKAPPLTRGMRALVGKFIYFDNAKAVSELGFNPQPCGAAIQHSVDWFRESGHLSRRTVQPRKKSVIAARSSAPASSNT